MDNRHWYPVRVSPMSKTDVSNGYRQDQRRMLFTTQLQYCYFKARVDRPTIEVKLKGNWSVSRFFQGCICLFSVWFQFHFNCMHAFKCTFSSTPSLIKFSQRNTSLPKTPLEKLINFSFVINELASEIGLLDFLTGVFPGSLRIPLHARIAACQAKSRYLGLHRRRYIDLDPQPSPFPLTAGSKVLTAG